MEKPQQILKPVTLFYSYAQADEKLRDRLETHLSLLHKQGLITQWHHHQIMPGADRQKMLDAYLMSASIILLLISPDFLASDYCYSVEMQRALERDKRGEAIVIPILLRPGDWEDAPFMHLQHLPRNGKAVTLWSNRDKAFAEIAKNLRVLIRQQLSSLSEETIYHNPSTMHLREIPSETSIQPDQNVNSVIQKVPMFSRRSLHIVIWAVNFLATSMLSIILRFTPPTTGIPLIGYIQQHQIASIIIMSGTILLSLIISLIALGRVEKNKQKSQHDFALTLEHPSFLRGESRRAWSFASITSTISFMLCITMLFVVFIQSPWCSSSLCFALKSSTRTNFQGAYDENLNLYFEAFESPYFVIPSEPAFYTLKNLPEHIGAVRLDGPMSPIPYRIVLNVHSLLSQGGFAINIMQINLLVQQVPPSISPLDVWTPGSQVDYANHPYRGVYNGQHAGDTLPVLYTIGHDGYVQLKPNETDTLDVQLASYVPVDLKFRVQVIYRVTNKPTLYKLTLPTLFEVIFSNKANWHSYHFANNHFNEDMP